ncbi:hypothetical protein AWB67_05300 [Caballeronia terrestris]|uniref:Uncharacterized protein n=1 Tax=Caballeronia terrestris TaxID=1226301 RepID=A0A158KDK7_9BURK|nr:hypothetical protein AWB67_05300 [Caballeronia terrestris]
MVYGLLRDQITRRDKLDAGLFLPIDRQKKTLHMLPRAVREGQLSNDQRRDHFRIISGSNWNLKRSTNLAKTYLTDEKGSPRVQKRIN